MAQWIVCAQLRPIPCDPMSCSQTPLSMGFPRQEYWSSCHFLPPGIVPTQGSKLHSGLPLSHLESPRHSEEYKINNWNAKSSLESPMNLPLCAQDCLPPPTLKWGPLNNISNWMRASMHKHAFKKITVPLYSYLSDSFWKTHPFSNQMLLILDTFLVEKKEVNEEQLWWRVHMTYDVNNLNEVTWNLPSLY